MEFLGSEGRELLAALEEDNSESQTGSDSAKHSINFEKNSNLLFNGNKFQRNSRISRNESYPLKKSNCKSGNDAVHGDSDHQKLRPYLLPLGDDLEFKLRKWSESQRQKV